MNCLGCAVVWLERARADNNFGVVAESRIKCDGNLSRVNNVGSYILKLSFGQIVFHCSLKHMYTTQPNQLESCGNGYQDRIIQDRSCTCRFACHIVILHTVSP